ncbi:hypothetical protein [Paenibacillus vini]|uniref:hypothetical protein n=1 Tax=Paenibacillus TaxID=44249 RepID=UPI003F498A2F
MGRHIHPLGWDNWDDPANESTVRYEEYGSRNVSNVQPGRVPWAECSETAPGRSGSGRSRFLAGFHFCLRLLRGCWHTMKSKLQKRFVLLVDSLEKR